MDATHKSEPHFVLTDDHRKLWIKGHWQGHVSYCEKRFPVIDSSSLALAKGGTMAGVSQSLEILARWVHTVQCITRPRRPSSWHRLTEFRPDPCDYYSAARTVISDYVQDRTITSGDCLDVIDRFLLQTTLYRCLKRIQS